MWSASGHRSFSDLRNSQRKADLAPWLSFGNMQKDVHMAELEYLKVSSITMVSSTDGLSFLMKMLKLGCIKEHSRKPTLEDSLGKRIIGFFSVNH